MENNTNIDLITLVQKPIISEKLQAVSKAIDEETSKALSMPCTEETRKEVKQARADLNKQFKELEDRRKIIKDEISKPYNEFIEKIYNPLIADKFKNADEELKEKINSVENELKAEKQKEIEQYFKDYANSLEIDFLDFSKANINILLSKTDKTLKIECRDYIDKIKQDLDFIETRDDKEEVLYEYKNNNYNLREALQIVEMREKAIEAEKAKKALEEKIGDKGKERQDEIVEIINEYETIEQPKQDENKQDEILTCTFQVKGTKEQLKAIKNFLIENKIEYK